MRGNKFGRLGKGIPKSPEWKQKASLSKMGDLNPMKNPLIAAKMAASKRGVPNPKVKEFWRLHKDEQIARMMRGAASKRPNKLEVQLTSLIRKNGLPYRYVGDWKLIVGGRCPDFVSDGGRHVIELFGDYWHDEKERITPEERASHYKSHGYGLC